MTMTLTPYPSPRATQRGVSLIFAIMTLVVMSLAAVALVRSVDIGALILGNIGFKQDATSASAVVTAQAIAELNARLAAKQLDVDDSANGYYARSLDNLDPTGGTTTATNKLSLVDWLGDGSCSYADASTFTTCYQAKLGTTVNGNSVRWIITRLCKLSNEQALTATNPCQRPIALTSASTATEKGSLNSPTRPIPPPSMSPYYRIIVRTEGARHTVSFTEALVHF